ncbi:MAG: ATP-binding cassette domain-containing protein [Chitinivibrionales bacterium]|nr:ATP-binding cassette domain-containing protein [Chitinivibrionales bacterium]
MKGMITVGSVVVFTTYFARVSGWVMGLLETVPNIKKSIESLRSVKEVLYSSDKGMAGGSIAIPTLNGRFELKDIHYTYPHAHEPSLSRINLTIEPGTTIGLMGPSGSGKTTLINVLLGFLTPQVGKCLIDGNPLEKLDLRSFRSRIGVVPQETRLFSGTILENITYGITEISIEEVMRALADAHLLEFVQSLSKGVHTPIGDGGVDLSGGQKQRLGIARAFVRNPSVLFMDEPTSSLDIESQFHVKEAMLHLMKGRTAIVASHALSVIRHVDTIVVMENGVIAQCGTHTELHEGDNFYASARRRVMA